MSGPNYEVVSQSLTIPGGTDVYLATASAPTGKVITGVGYSNGPLQHYPSADGTQWTFEYQQQGSSATVTVYLVCL